MIFMAIPTTISLENAKKDKLFYFVANVVVYRASDKRCLLLKRSSQEKAHPGKYCVPGGKLEWKNLPLDKPTRINGDILDYEHVAEDLLAREVEEEAGIVIERRLRYLNSVAFIRPDGIPVVLMKFAAKYLSGEVTPEEGAFTHHVWVDAQEAKGYDCIKGIPEEIEETIRLFHDARHGA